MAPEFQQGPPVPQPAGPPPGGGWGAPPPPRPEEQRPPSVPPQAAAIPEAQQATPLPRGPEGEARDPLEVPADAPRTLAGFLVSYEGNDLGSFYPIYQGKNVVGRKAAADGLDIEIDHPTTSSRHAVVFASACPGRFKVEDSGSTNGTFINDQKLVKGICQELSDGDKLRFGGYALTVKIV
jgi:pSer/pThr/pTyr-binding forkhead associated (FHA) protein